MSRLPNVWRILLAYKVAMLMTVTAVLLWTAGFHWSKPPSEFLAPWDGGEYLALSQQGYQRDFPSCAFYPLWPGIIGIFAKCTFGNPLVAGLLLANGMSLLGMWLFYGLAARSSGEAVATDAVVLMLAFPGALFFSFPYTESLFLLLVLALFRGLERQSYVLPCIMAFLLPLTKAVGIFIIFPLAWHLYEGRKPLRHYLMLLSPLLGYATYFAVMHAFTGNAFEGFEAQKQYPNAPSIMNVFDLPGLIRGLGLLGTFDGMLDGVLDRFLFVVFLSLLPLVYRLNRTWFAYSLPMVLIPALTNWFLSYRRFSMMCFPVFIVLAQLLRGTGGRFLFNYVVTVLVTLQAWAIFQFVRSEWAG